MPNYYDLFSSPRTKTYAAIAVVNAIKQSVASAVTPSAYTGGQLDGATGAAVMSFPQLITVTTAAHSGSYKTGAANAIVVTGTDFAGQAQTDTLVLTQTNGGDALSTTKAFASVTEIDVPGQNDTSGSFQFGVGDIVMPSSNPIRELRGGQAGNIAVGYQGGFTDTLPCLEGERHDVLATSIKSTNTTALPVTVYA